MAVEKHFLLSLVFMVLMENIFCGVTIPNDKRLDGNVFFTVTNIKTSTLCGRICLLASRWVGSQRMTDIESFFINKLFLRISGVIEKCIAHFLKYWSLFVLLCKLHMFSSQKVNCIKWKNEIICWIPLIIYFFKHLFNAPGWIVL